jgi:ElaB/YqjD/DUF883 family membrane-anchored ribosome-binding protein
MTTSQLESAWGSLKGKLKQRYSQLTDDDLTFAQGKAEELLNRLQVKLGLSRAELNATLDDLTAAAQGKLDEVKAKAAEVSDQVRAKAGHMVEDLKQRAAAIGEDAKAQGAAAYDEARQRARGLWEDGEEYVRKNPLESVLIGVVAGFVAGIILSRR